MTMFSREMGLIYMVSLIITTLNMVRLYRVLVVCVTRKTINTKIRVQHWQLQQFGLPPLVRLLSIYELAWASPLTFDREVAVHRVIIRSDDYNFQDCCIPVPFKGFSRC